MWQWWRWRISCSAWLGRSCAKTRRIGFRHWPRLLELKTSGNFLLGLLADHVDGTTVEPALSKPDIGRGLSRPSQLYRKRAGGLHHGQESLTPTKAEYIGADLI